MAGPHSSRGSLAGLREGNPRRTEIAPKREEVSLFSVVGVAGHPQSCRGWRTKHWALGAGPGSQGHAQPQGRDPGPSMIPGVAPAWTQPSASPVSFQWEGVLSGPCMSAWQGSQEACDVPSFPVGLGPRRPCWCWDSGPLSGAAGAEGSHEDKEPCVGPDSWALTSCSWLTGKSWAGGVTVPRPTMHRPPPGQPRSLWPQQNLTPLLNLQNHLLELTHHLSTGDSQDGMPRTRGRKARAHILFLMTLLRVRIPALPLVSCVTSGKSLDLSVPQFLHLQNRVDDEHKGTYFKGFCQGLTKLILLKH